MCVYVYIDVYVYVRVCVYVYFFTLYALCILLLNNDYNTISVD